MNHFDVSKILFYVVSIAGILGLVFSFGLYSGTEKTVVYTVLRDIKNTIQQSFHEAATVSGIKPEHFLQPARYQGEGVTINDVSPTQQEDLIFLSGFFENSNELRLINRNGDLVARWPVRFSEIFPDISHLENPPKTDWNIDTHGALILPDGSVVFNFEYSGLARLDRCGNVIWTLARMTHHSVERAENGGFWVPGRRFYKEGEDSPFPPFKTPFTEDTLLKVSEDGNVLTEISVPKLFYDNGLEAFLTSTGHKFEKNLVWDHEIIHLNKIDELSSDIVDDFPMFEAGDLALSLRTLNLVMVVDPNTSKVKWWRIGPWLRQHDPEFKSGGTITLFNNNTYQGAFFPGLKSSVSLPRVSNIVEINPATDQYRIIYGSKKGQPMLSVIRGKHELIPNGGLLITEFQGGRVFETDAEGGIIWEYINRYSLDEIAEITEARLYPTSYFSVSDWSCSDRGSV